MQTLIKVLEAASHSYFNEGKFYKPSNEECFVLEGFLPAGISSETITDQVFDLLEDELRKIDSNHSFFSKIGAKVVKNKAKLPIEMSGLEKITVNDSSVAKWLSEHPGEKIISNKLDGISILVEADGSPKAAYTRGDGFVGEDISYLLPHLNLPKTTQFKYLRGEIIMKIDAFKKNWSDKYENPRNLAAGVSNSAKIHKAVKDIEVVFYGVLDKDNRLTPSESLEQLKLEGFNVVEFEVLQEVSEELLSQLLKAKKASSPYELDGLVISDNFSGLDHVKDNPEFARKFKENIDFHEVIVVDCKYDLSKDGYAKPVLEIEPTRMNGVTVTNVTAFNHGFVTENRLGKGAKILITRSGDVIPHIVEVLQGVEEVFAPSESWLWNDTGVDAVVPDPDNHPVVKLKRVNFFFKTLKIDELGESTFEKAMDAGFNTIDLIIKMTQEDWKNISGFEGRRGEIAYTEIQKCLSKVYLPNLADATGLFGRGFGTTRFELLLEAQPELMTMFNDLEQTHQENVYLVVAMATKGFGSTLANQFANGMPKFLTWFESMKDYFTIVEPEKTEVVGDKFANQIISFTGFRNADWVKAIEEQGGKFADFGSKTTMLIYGGKKSSKIEKAESKGIQTISQAEFQAMIDIK